MTTHIIKGVWSEQEAEDGTLYIRIAEENTGCCYNCFISKQDLDTMKEMEGDHGICIEVKITNPRGGQVLGGWAFTLVEWRHCGYWKKADEINTKRTVALNLRDIERLEMAAGVFLERIKSIRSDV